MDYQETVDTFLYFVLAAIFLGLFVLSNSNIPIIGSFFASISYFFKTWTGIIVVVAISIAISFFFEGIFDYLIDVVAALLIAYSTYGILVAFEIAPGTFGGGLVGWAISGLIVMFVFGFFAGIYKSSGGDVSQLLVAAIIVSILVYLSLGPWSDPVRRYVRVVKEPLKQAIELASAQAEEMKLIVLDPMGWYQRQQMKNAAADDVNPPVGVEILSIDNRLGKTLLYKQPALFDIYIKNKGEHPAENVVVGYECEGCSQSSDSKSIGRMDPDEERVVTLQLTPKPHVIKNAIQSHIDVTYYVKYTYSTETILDVKIMRQEDADRIGYKQVLSYTDNAPAVISLNVGRQPLRGGEEQYLMISFIKQKLGGKVNLGPSSAVVYIPKRLTTTKPTCKGSVGSSVSSETVDGVSYWVVHITPGNKIIDKSRPEYTVCSLKPPVPDETMTISGLITAKFSNYQYIVESKSTYVVDLIGGKIINK